jgi:toxin secretion/phage lysis holin
VVQSSLPGWLRFILSGVAALGGYLYGPSNSWMIALLAFIIFDYLTGVIVGYLNKQLSSATGIKGLLKKIGILVMVALANIIDKTMGVSGAIKTVVILFFCANEGLSIPENCAKMGLPIPQKLIDALEQLKKTEATKQDETVNKQDETVNKKE